MPGCLGQHVTPNIRSSPPGISRIQISINPGSVVCYSLEPGEVDLCFDQLAASARPKNTINARFSCTR